jgi:hypothetical protein
MKHNLKNITLGLIAIISLAISSCQKGDLLSNPNVVAESSTVPASLLLNHLTANLMKEEEPIISTVYRYNQNIVSNYSYYFGSNAYNWSTTSDTYDQIKYCTKLEEQAQKQYGNTTNIYFALSKFLRAYSFVWLTQRVGDIPMTQAGNTSILTPKYDTQHDVYKNSLALLDTANTLISALYSTATAGNKVDAAGDVFGLTYLQWQKVINTYKLRVLISLSKRATDNADLNIPGQFAAIINNPTKYPIMTSNSDNMTFKYTAITLYPPNRSGNAPYNNCANINKTFMNLLTANQDPRTFVLTTPALKYITSNAKTVADFTAYVGLDNNLAQSSFANFSADSSYACMNYYRYMNSASGANAEPYILVGYPEMCFNIAEAANRGWITSQSAATWYVNGINASLNLYGITQGKAVTVGDYSGNKTSYGTVTLDVNTFLSNVAYAGDNTTGLNQILTQKYVAFWMNSGYEAFYNWRRTGVPTFNQGGAGIGTTNNAIPLRWQYPVSEVNYNADNYTAALQSQYGGTDDVNAKMWLIK